MTNPFADRAPALSDPAREMLPVTPSDSTNLSTTAVALYIEEAGTVVFDTVAGNTRTVKVTDYAVLPVGVRRVRATGTTATGIFALVIA